MRAKQASYKLVLGDLSAAGLDLGSLIADIGSWGAMALDIISFLGHVGAFIVDWQAFNGGSLPSGLAWLPGVVKWVKLILPIVNAFKGVLNAFNFTTGWIKNLMQNFVAKDGWHWAASLTGFGSAGSNFIVNGVGDLVLTPIPSDTTISQYSNQQAYNLCLPIEGEGLCQGN